MSIAEKSNRLERKRVIEILTHACAEAGGQSWWAKDHKISVQYVCDVLKDRREPGKLILDALGLEKLVSYREKTR